MSASDERYRSLFEHHPDAVYEFDLEGRFVACNAAASDVSGYSRDELLAMTFEPIIQEQDRPTVIAQFTRAARGEAVRYDCACVRKDGQPFLLDVTNLPIVVEGRVVGVYGIGRDVTRAREAQQDIEAREARYRRMFDAAGIGIATTDLAGRHIGANPAFVAMTGLTDAELSQRTFQSLTHPDDRARLAGVVAALAAGGPPHRMVQTRLLRADGAVAHLRSSLTLLTDVEGGPHVLGVVEDITERVATERQLEQARDLVRLAGSMARLGAWRVDVATGVTWWSDEVYEILEYPLTEVPVLDEAMVWYPQPHRSVVEFALHRCSTEGVPFDLEVQISTARDRLIWIRVVGEPQHDTDGTIVSIAGALQDVDSRRRAELVARESADRLAMAFESITDAVMIIDHDWRFSYLNHQAGEVLLRRPEELVGRSLWEEFPRVSDLSLGPAFRAAMDHRETQTIEEYHDAEFGAWFTVSVFPSPEGITIHMRDISEAHRARAELQAREAQLREQARLLDEARDAIIVRDLGGVITYWNRSAAALYGWSAEEAVGQSARQLLYRDPTVFDDADTQARTTGDWNGELAQVTRSGRELIAEGRWTLVRDEAGHPRSIMAFNTDVTERRRLQQQALHAQRMESLGTLAGGIAHDLNNTLSPVLLASQLLAEDEQDPQRREMLQVIQDTAQRSADLVRQVLAFAHPVEGRRAPVGVADLVEQVRWLVAETFPRAIQWQADIAREGLTVQGDATQLYQVLVNLCVNARDAMGRGGVLRVDADEVVLTDADASVMGAPGPGTYVRVSVSDTGDGMPDDVLDRAFEPFFTTKQLGHGTGLGLSTSLGIVESHGGFLSVETVHRVGTAVHVHLPPAAVASGTVPPRRQAEVPAGDGRLVLVVEDEDPVRQVTVRALEDAGYRTVTAADGAQAVAVFAAHEDEVALVVTDMMMPVMDGAATIAVLRDLRADLPVVAVSGLYDGARPDTAHRLVKPFTIDELLRAVADALDDPDPTVN